MKGVPGFGEREVRLVGVAGADNNPKHVVLTLASLLQVMPSEKLLSELEGDVKEKRAQISVRAVCLTRLVSTPHHRHCVYYCILHVL